MTIDEAYTKIRKTDQIRKIISQLKQVEELLCTHSINHNAPNGSRVLLEVVYEAGDETAEQKLLDLLLYLHEKYEIQLGELE